MGNRSSPKLPQDLKLDIDDALRSQRVSAPPAASCAALTSPISWRSVGHWWS